MHIRATEVFKMGSDMVKYVCSKIILAAKWSWTEKEWVDVDSHKTSVVVHVRADGGFDYGVTEERDRTLTQET